MSTWGPRAALESTSKGNIIITSLIIARLASLDATNQMNGSDMCDKGLIPTTPSVWYES
jgi:hypothetical protein